MKLSVTFVDVQGKMRVLTFLLEDRREIVLFAKHFLSKQPDIANFIYHLIPEKLVEEIINQEDEEKCQPTQVSQQ